MSENFRGRRSRSVEHDARNLEVRHSPNESYDDLKVGSFPNDSGHKNPDSNHKYKKPSGNNDNEETLRLTGN